MNILQMKINLQTKRMLKLRQGQKVSSSQSISTRNLRLRYLNPLMKIKQTKYLLMIFYYKT